MTATLLLGSRSCLSTANECRFSRIVKQGPLSAQQVIQVLAMLLQVDRVDGC